VLGYDACDNGMASSIQRVTERENQGILVRLGGLARASTIQRPCRGSPGHAIGIAKWIVKMGQVESSRRRIIKDRPDSERG